MEIVLYRNLSEPNVIVKSLTAGISVNGNIRTDFNISNPSILIQGIDPSGYNYCWIPAVNRYYFITNSTAVSPNLVLLDLGVDVLMSFKDLILHLEAIISGNEKLGNAYLPSQNYPCEERQFIQVMSFENGDKFETDGCYILIVAGG